MKNREDAEEGSSPVQTAMTCLDAGHLALDAFKNGGKTTGELALEGAEAWAGESSAFDSAVYGSNAIASPLSILGGIWDTVEGAEAYRRGDAGGAVAGLGGGISSIVSGVAGAADLAGVASAPMVAAPAAAGAMALKVTHAGDESARDLGWFHDADGNALTASGAAGALGASADDWVTEHTHSSALGTAAGIGATALAVPGAATAALAAGGVKGVEKVVDTAGAVGTSIGARMANHDRAARYANPFELDGFSSIGHYDPATGTVKSAVRGTPEADVYAQDYADYEDGLPAAERRGLRNTGPEWIKRVRAISRGAS